MHFCASGQLCACFTIFAWLVSIYLGVAASAACMRLLRGCRRSPVLCGYSLQMQLTVAV